MENQDGGHPVYGFAPFLDREVGFPEQAVGFGGGQAFVPKVDGELEMLAQVLGEILDLFGLDTLCATHAQREADDDLFHLIIPDDTIQITEIVFLVLPMEGFQALCGNAERVRYGYTDSTRPDIEPEDAMGWVCEVGSHAGIIVGFRLSARQGLGVKRRLTSFPHRPAGSAVFLPESLAGWCREVATKNVIQQHKCPVDFRWCEPVQKPKA